MKLIKDYVGGDSRILSPVERVLFNQICPKIELCNRGILEVSILKDTSEALVRETSRTTNIDKRILQEFVNSLFEDYLDEVIDARYSEKDIEKFAAQHRSAIHTGSSKPSSHPKEKHSFAVMHHDGKMWRVEPHTTIESATRDYVRKSNAAKKNGTKVKIVDHEGNVIHSTN